MSGMSPNEISCPHCARTLSGSDGMVEQTLFCPDCQASFKPPEVRLGVNARCYARPSEKSTSAYPSSILGQDMLAAELLVDNLESLFRRKEEMGKQIDKLVSNAEVCRKQIELLKHPAAEATAGAAPPDSERRLLMIAVAVTLTTLCSALVVLLLSR
jgi:hypothetical protein